MSKPEKLTAKELEAIQAYLTAMRELEAREPEYSSFDDDAAAAWGAWQKEGIELTRKYHDTIRKALVFSLGDMTDTDPQSVAAILAALLPDNRPRVNSNPATSLDFPLDKINANIWSLLETIEPTGQIAIATEKRGSAKEATILYSINFDEIDQEVSISKKLTPFDKRCYIAVAALFNNGNPIISAGQIYTAMGNKGRPNAKDLQKINSSITKMGAARVYINNEQEITVNRRYNRFVYDAPLLPFERISAYINNLLCESAIHLFREPPLITFAKDRKQVTTISRELLESPISKTDANLRIDDYLIERIAHIKNGRVRNKLLYATIFQRCGITEKKQRQRAPEKIRRYLEHYAKCGFIKGFTEAADGVTITY